MENKINVAELLRDCPSGMELDCTMYEDVYFDWVDGLNIIHCYIQHETHKTSITFNQHGTPNSDIKSKCVIFPKGKTTWEGFQRPFVDGDVVALDCEEGAQLFIFKEYIHNHDCVKCYMMLDYDGEIDFDSCCYYVGRLATKEEKQKLFDTIEANGYKWNEETKALEKLSEFKDGDIVTWKDKGWMIACIYKKRKNSTTFNHHAALYKGGLNLVVNGEIVLKNDELCLATEEEKAKLFQAIKDNGYRWNDETKTLENLFPYKIGTKVWVKSDKEHKYLHTIVGISCNSFGNLEYEVKEEKTSIVVHYPKGLLIPVTEEEPKFKVGNRIRLKENHNYVYTITAIREKENKYECGVTFVLRFSEQDNWELVPNKFDINTLVPFESRVLARDNDKEKWHPGIWGFYDSDCHDFPYKLIGDIARYCIPYEGNEHLRGKTDDCDKYFKTWE